MSEPMIEVKPHIRERAHIKTMEEYQRLYRLSFDNPEWFWGEQAKTLTWYHPWHKVFDADYDEVDFAWYSGGRLNACYNCVDRHLETHGDQHRDHLGRRRAGRVQAHLVSRAEAPGLPARERAARARRAEGRPRLPSTCR